ncbi:MAG: ABC transporter ATP-binding protein [Lentisphaeria bacterium]|nr:ABC transporter ATP-binding protein [Lentisphaeria bacterium]
MLLEVKNLVKSFGSTIAVNDASFSIPEGKIYGFIGPNGAGKSTTLRIIAGLEEPDSGDVLFDGASAVDFPEKLRRSIGFMPDTLPDVNDLRVKEFIDFYASAFGLKGEERSLRIKKIHELTRLGELQEKFISQLSKGMKQRVNLARILIHDPKLLLLDEPAAGLDPMTRIEMRDIFKSLAAEGKTIFLSSHILSELEEMVSGIVIIEKGKILRHGSVEQLSNAPEEQESVIVNTIPGTDNSLLLEHIKQVPAVRSVRLTTNGAVEIITETAKFHELMQFFAESRFPLASLQRKNFSASLEDIFIKNTSGEVQ